MILIINTNSNQVSRLKNALPPAELTWIGFKAEESLVAQINQFIKPLGKQLQDIKGIVLIQGAGSFSNTRSAVVFANILKLTAGIPVIALSKEQFKESFSKITQLLEQQNNYIEASYSSQPNITPQPVE